MLATTPQPRCLTVCLSQHAEAYTAWVPHRLLHLLIGTLPA